MLCGCESKPVMAETPAETSIVTPDPEKVFLQAFAPDGIAEYQITEFTTFAVWVNADRYYNVAGYSNGTWVLISRIKIPDPEASPEATPNK